MSGLELYDPATTKADKRPVSTTNPVPTASAFGDSGKAAVTGSLASSTATSAFTPIPGRTFYLTLNGTGSATVTVTVSRDGTNFYPEAVATDGAAPIILNKVAYDGGTQNGVRIPLQQDEYGVTVKALPGVVTGPITYTFSQ